MNQLTSYCTIKNNRITVNGLVVFEGEGALENFMVEAYDKLGINYPKFYKMDNLSKLGLLASDLMLSGSDLVNQYKPEQVAVILANSSSSLETDLKYWESTKQIASPGLFVYTLPNIVGGEICIRHGLKGENGFFIFDHFDPEFMATYVDIILDQNAKACIAGWVEVSEEQYDVFLYLVENNKHAGTTPHTIQQLAKLYK